MPHAPALSTLQLEAAPAAERHAEEEKCFARELNLQLDLQEEDAAFARDLELRRLRRKGRQGFKV